MMFRSVLSAVLIGSVSLFSLSALQGPIPAREAHYWAPEGDILLPAPDEVLAATDDDFSRLPLAYTTQGAVDPDRLKWCETVIARSLAVLPDWHVKGLHDLTLTFDRSSRRGLAGGNTMIIRCVGVEEAELMRVVWHEMGHVVDTGILHSKGKGSKSRFDDRGNSVYTDDPSFEYYALSWESSRSFTGSPEDVVSGYAGAQVAQEDFAEAYSFYVAHGELFRFYSYRNTVLKSKYDFLRDVVFDGMEFSIPERLPRIVEMNEREYDATRVDFDLTLESVWAQLESRDSKLY